MKISYNNNKIKKYFENYDLMQKEIGLDWVRNIKKHINRLKAADTFGDFLKVNLGHPEPLTGKDNGKYSLHITGNVRLIIRPNGEGTDVTTYEEFIVEGVVDYHGGKTKQYIP